MVLRRVTVLQVLAVLMIALQNRPVRPFSPLRHTLRSPSPLIYGPLPTDALPRSSPHEPRSRRSMVQLPRRPFPGLPIEGERAFSLLTVSAPNSSEKYNPLQDRRGCRSTRRPRRPHAPRPVPPSRQVDVSPTSLSSSQRASALLAPCGSGVAEEPPYAPNVLSSLLGTLARIG